MKIFFHIFLIATSLSISWTMQAKTVSLNGKWTVGNDRTYTHNVTIPGIVANPTQLQKGKLWFRRQITLPYGDWNKALLELKGARFMPEVYVNKQLVSKQNGGMSTTYHPLGEQVKPGETIELEIALTSLADVPETDASFIPEVDQWRSNVSSCIWDDIVLHLYRDNYIGAIIPKYDSNKKQIELKFQIESASNEQSLSGNYNVQISDNTGKVLLSQKGVYTGREATVSLRYGRILKEWSPDAPIMYRLKIDLLNKNKLNDSKEINIGIKQFEVRNKQFYLNGKPCKLRGGTVVWHRWVRSPEGAVYGYDTTWFANNVVKRLKAHGANYLRFHLGVPPERLLDVCDKYGLLVQYEWNFFHGMPASKESLLEQFPAWFNVAMKHPCVALYHPYNETEGEQLKTVWGALNEVIKRYPPIVLEDRDVLHIHKYWWSLFENVGIYYDDAAQFDKAIMVDEFGGNYLDEKGELGGYKALKESFLRFMGRSTTTTERLQFQAMSATKIAEYWRRINAAGVAPFVIASSWEDGNTWFLDSLSKGIPKPIWNALTVAYSPKAVSMDIWDKNFLPCEKIKIPLYMFNDTETPDSMHVHITVEDSTGNTYSADSFTDYVSAFSKKMIEKEITLPDKEGSWILKTELLNRPAQVKYPVVSEWTVHTLMSQAPDILKKNAVALGDGEDELKLFLQKKGILIKPLSDKSVHLFVLSKINWSRIASAQKEIKEQIAYCINNNISVLLLNAGDQYLGQGYPEKAGDLGPLQGVVKIDDPRKSSCEIYPGVKLEFTEMPEPESFLYPDINDASLWWNLPQACTGIWNGMRGGLLLPAADLNVVGLSQPAFLEQWKTRGADENLIKTNPYYAYELQGFYAFSLKKNDSEAQKELRQRVIFLVQDAPSLAASINTQSPINQVDLHSEYLNAQSGNAKKITILANAGKNLTRTPILKIDFGENHGNLIISQLLTNGRLDKAFEDSTHYGIKQDEAAAQMTLNLMAAAIK